MGSTIDKILQLNKNNVNSIKLLSENCFDKNKIENANIIFIAHESCIKKFKVKFADIYNKSIKIIIFRNPIDRIQSSYNYMKCNKSYSYYLKNIIRDPNNIKDCIGINYCAFYVHFETTQADAIDYDQREYHSDKYIWLSMDNIDNIFKFLKNELKLKFPHNLHENKTIVNSGKINIKKEDMELFRQKFKDDIVLFNKL